MTLVHGDAKIDNFLFKKVGQSAEDKYTAMIIDWQVTTLVDTDLGNLSQSCAKIVTKLWQSYSEVLTLP